MFNSLYFTNSLITYYFSRAQSDHSQNNSYPNDITYSNNSLQENHSSNTSAQCSDTPVLVSQTKKHQTTQQVIIRYILMYIFGGLIY